MVARDLYKTNQPQIQIQAAIIAMLLPASPTLQFTQSKVGIKTFEGSPEFIIIKTCPSPAISRFTHAAKYVLILLLALSAAWLPLFILLCRDAFLHYTWLPEIRDNKKCWMEITNPTLSFRWFLLITTPRSPGFQFLQPTVKISQIDSSIFLLICDFSF